MVKVFEFTPTALNFSNDTVASGFINSRTLQDVNAGGLLLGDAIDLDTRTAFSLSNLAVGTLYEGRYRRIQVDANATAANVKTGTIAFLAPGSSVSSVNVVLAGVAQTPGTYIVQSTGGGGSGASISVTVAPGGTVTAAPVVVAGGSGFTSVPTFALTGAGGTTTSTFLANMSLNTYIVTSADKAGIIPFPRAVFLNSITPGNYGWVQELGIASVLQAVAVTSATLGAIVTPVSGGNGTVQATVGTGSPTAYAIGLGLDIPSPNGLYRILLSIAEWQG